MEFSRTLISRISRVDRRKILGGIACILIALCFMSIVYIIAAGDDLWKKDVIWPAVLVTTTGLGALLMEFLSGVFAWLEDRRNKASSRG